MAKKPRVKLKHAAPAASLGGSAYVAGDPVASDALVSFQPRLASADAEVLDDRDLSTARARDLVRNNGWSAGAVAREIDAVLGANFRPMSKPDWKALGLDAVWAGEFAEEIDAAWRSYADDPRFLADASRQSTVSQLFALAYRHYLVDGDATGVIRWMPERPTATVLRVTDPDLLSNPQDGPDEERMRGGVELDEDGAAVAYHFRRGHRNDRWATTASMEWDSWPRERAWGRPMVLHYFDKHRDGQTRGMSRLAPIVETLQMERHYSKVEIQAAVLNAMLGAFIQSPFDGEALMEMLGEETTNFTAYTQQRADFHKDRKISMGGVRLPFLFPGEQIGTVAAARPAAQFADFQGAVLRQIASGLGMSYEQLANDWSKTNYSSARAALIEVWRGWTANRHVFAQRFCQPFRMAWLEEMIDAGRIRLPRNAPDFYDNWTAYARAKWIGPGKGFVDPVKEAQASAMRIALGISTLEDEAAELTGSDYLENLAQIRREIDQMPEGVLHPAQESFAKLIGGDAPSDRREEAAAS